ncbi:transposase [Asinibacterium sp. OR53]|uniref:transposase n=1 Tax=Asinibacterium sp. OR53 TaxID=925409 RepID=UPI000686C68A
MELEILYNKFKTQEDCIKLLEKILWDDKPKCPYCSSKNKTAMPRESRYHCGNCRSSYSVTARTIFHKTKVDLQKWFVAIPLITKDKISARQLAKAIHVTKDTACFMANRIKIANQESPEFIKHFI